MSSDERTCYYPEGNVGSDLVPCTSDDVTHCCGSGGICLTNGYCLDVGQPFVASRGGCTSNTWASGCPTQCQDVLPDEGTSIINLSYENGISLYCCGTPVYNGSAIVCPYGNSFELDDGSAILGRAALVNATTKTSTTSNATTTTSSNSSAITTSSSSSDNSHNVAIGVGVGIPLFVIAVGTLLWALWERRRANRLSKSLISAGVAQGGYGEASVGGRSSSRPTELDPQVPVAELMEREQAAEK
ncbi:uncharacterized protein N7483_000760 [Penicillium malachiteum]|uniref:uncharacterized protein n=1 Tax=Penicillium malachiteum TaxID=1324776 RepID=UPI002548FB3F|nr:uncharacterized protein N7483_000760 [Penicillium malachiteum]KAJ5735635.1 hypothetical protein N7483_000760 [Penicillium malachiteum]